MTLETIPELVLGNGRRFAAAPAYLVRGSDGWKATSWEGYAAEVRRAGAAIVALGVEPGQAVCILGANRPEWVIFDVAAMAAGAIPAGIYATSSPPECEYIVNHSEAPVLLVENEAQWQKITAVRDRLPHLRHVVMMQGAPAVEGYPVDNRGKKVDLTMAYVGTRKLFADAGFTKALDTRSVSGSSAAAHSAAYTRSSSWNP